MKLFKSCLFLLMIGMLCLTSCQKDSFDTTSNEETEVQTEENLVNNAFAQMRTDGDGLEFDCLTILYPFDLVTEDGTLVPITSDGDFEAAFLDSSAIFVDFGYPLTVENEDEVEVSVSSLDELVELFASCIPDDGWNGDEDCIPAFLIDAENSCVELVYPVTLSDHDEVEYVANSEAEFIDLLAAHEWLFFEFPVTLEGEDGQIVVNNADEFFTALYDCDDYTVPCDSIGFGGVACYTLEFPVDLLLTDGSVTTANDEDEFYTALFEGNVEDFVYPITLTDVDGNVLVIGSADELQAAIDDCYDIDWGDFPWVIDLFLFSDAEIGCYAINYPIEIETPNGTVTVNNNQEYVDLLNANDPVQSTIVYPVTITTVDGNVVTLESNEDLVEVIEDCEG